MSHHVQLEFAPVTHLLAFLRSTGSHGNNKNLAQAVGRDGQLLFTVLFFIALPDDESDPEASELDLGTKIKTPKDVMLEELSLLNNKGSKMFKMRQQRVEKFIVTNENNVGASHIKEALLSAIRL